MRELGECYTIVPCDMVVGNSHSGIIVGLATMGINDTKIKVLIWFDNGWGYSARIIDTINKLSESSTHE